MSPPRAPLRPARAAAPQRRVWSMDRYKVATPQACPNGTAFWRLDDAIVLMNGQRSQRGDAIGHTHTRVCRWHRGHTGCMRCCMERTRKKCRRKSVTVAFFSDKDRWCEYVKGGETLTVPRRAILRLLGGGGTGDAGSAAPDGLGARGARREVPGGGKRS